jgi:hypothetical protein
MGDGGDMTSSRDICIICAWRADCQKKFSVSGRDIRCPDFVRDMLLPEEKVDEDKKGQKKEGDNKLK